MVGEIAPLALDMIMTPCYKGNRCDWQEESQAVYQVIVKEDVQIEYATTIACQFEHRDDLVQAELVRVVKRGLHSFRKARDADRFVVACGGHNAFRV